MKWYGQHGRKVSRIVIRYGEYGWKASWMVKRYGNYGRIVSWIVNEGNNKITELWTILQRESQNS